MVTGDALAIARETAKTLGMGTDILDAAVWATSTRDETAATAESIDDADGFAQVFPEHKFHIVDVLQKRGHIVGMTGDGVNDAPALKKADCGIAVSDATDAARAAASIVLTTPGLSVIIDAIKESRKIFQRMNSYAIYRIAETLARAAVRLARDLDLQLLPGDGDADRDAGTAQRRRHPVHRLRQRALPRAARGVEHAPRARDRHRARRRRSDRRLRHVLPRRQGVPPRPCASADPDVPDALGRRTPDDLPRTHPRSVLVDTAGADPPAGRARHAGAGDPASPSTESS